MRVWPHTWATLTVVWTPIRNGMGAPTASMAVVAGQYDESADPATPIVVGQHGERADPPRRRARALARAAARPRGRRAARPPPTPS